MSRFTDLPDEDKLRLAQGLINGLQTYIDELQRPGAFRLTRRCLTIDEKLFNEIFDIRIRNVGIRFFAL